MNNQLHHGQATPRSDVTAINHRKIARLLDCGTEQIDADIVSALRDARTAALKKQRVHEHAFSLSAIGHRAHNLLPHTTPQWLALTVLMAALLFGMAEYWQNAQDHQGNQLDLEILTSDLPMEVFVDK